MQRSMLRIPSLLLLAFSALLLVACEQSAAPPAVGALDYRPTLLQPGLVADALGAQHAGPVEGVLFDLATAPNGDILIANAVAGITNLHGEVEMALPGATNYAPIGRGTGWATTGAGGDPGANTGQALHRPSRDGDELIADLFAYEAANDPDDVNYPFDKPADSNPYAVASLGGGAALVVDAGGNDLLRVDNDGNVDLLAVFPNEVVSTENIKSLLGCPAPPPGLPPFLADACDLPPAIPAEAVPTSVAVGADGYYYVGELKGFPAPLGESNIWRVAPDAGGAVCPNPMCEKVFDGGFTSIVDLVFGPDGRLYIVELDEASWFAVEVAVFLGAPLPLAGTINVCDVDSGACEVVAGGIPIVTAVAFDKRGNLFATRNALIPPLAEVIEIP